MKLKKCIALSLAGLMTLSLAACGSGGGEKANESQKEESGSGANLTVSWWGNQSRNEKTQGALDLYSEQNPGVTFEGQFSEWSDYWNKLATSSASHSLPDIIQMDYKYLEQYVSNDLLVDLTPYVEDGTIDVSSVSEDILNSGKVGDGLYAIPTGINAPALIYNKTVTDQAGVTIKDNMSMDEFYDVCRQVYEKTGYKTDVAYGNGDVFIEYYMRSEGSILYEDGKLGSTQEQLEKFFDVYELGISEGWMCAPSIYAERTLNSPEQFPLVYGSSPDTMSWCAFTYSNQLGTLRTFAAEGTEIAMTTWPADDQVAADYLRPGMFFSVTVDSENPDESAKVLDFWTNSVEANEILLGERGVPISTTVADAISGAMSETDQDIVSYINEVVTPTSSVINPPAPEGSAQVSDLIDQLVEQVCYGQITAADAAEQLYTQGNSMMAN